MSESFSFDVLIGRLDIWYMTESFTLEKERFEKEVQLDKKDILATIRMSSPSAVAGKQR